MTDPQIWKLASERAEILGRAELDKAAAGSSRETALGWASHFFKLADQFGRLGKGCTFAVPTVSCSTTGTAHLPERHRDHERVSFLVALRRQLDNRAEFLVFGGSQESLDQLITNSRCECD